VVAKVRKRLSVNNEQRKNLMQNDLISTRKIILKLKKGVRSKSQKSIQLWGTL
jgi:hypothetical protein